MPPKQTVIIPAHNATWCLKDCIQSISEQTQKPHHVLIGVDACPTTMLAAVALKEAHDAEDRRRKGVLNIDVYWFPSHAYPYRIRNTMAIMADAGNLHFFDADDLMYPRHIELMGKAITDERYMACQAEVEMEKGGKREPWDRAHGIVSISRDAFLLVGGFEPWKCAADTEAQQRWQLDLLKCKPKEPTMVVRKHADGLTSLPSTGYDSALRKQYKQEIKRRTVEPVRLQSIGIAPCVKYTGQEIKELIMTPAPELQPDEIAGRLNVSTGVIEEDARDVALAEAYAALRYMMQVHGKGLNSKARRAYEIARQAIGDVR